MDCDYVSSFRVDVATRMIVQSLTTIYGDASWVLLAGYAGMGTFYNDMRLVGGN